jgi:peptide/nickel transport system substrate-binding protein
MLDAGRSELDEEAAEGIYEDLNRHMADQVHFLWLDWTLWTIATQPGIHGIQGATLPGGEQPSKGLATGHATSGIFRTGA